MSVSPDNGRALYIADQEMNDRWELHSVPITGGTVTKLNAPLNSLPGNVFLYRVSPDSSLVVYQEDFRREEIYSVPIAGGAATKLNGPIVPTGEVVPGGFNISADGSRVVYMAEQDTERVTELYSVPITGGAITKLNDPLREGGNVFNRKFSPDGNRVIYLATQETSAKELYSVPITGGTVSKVNGPLVLRGRVSSFHITPDSTRVVYMAYQDSEEDIEVYSVSITGGTVTKLNDPLVAGGDVLDARISPDGNRVLYWGDLDTDEVLELYSVPIDGGTATKLNGPLTAGGNVNQYSVSPDSSRTVFLGDKEVDSVNELYSVPTTGGGIIKLSNAVIREGENLSVTVFRISPDSSRVVYVGDQENNDVRELYSVPIDGGAVTKLNDPLAPGGDVSFNDIVISPNGNLVFYKADQDTDTVDELYAAPIAGGTVRKLNGPIMAGGKVTNYRLSPDGNIVIYRADQEVAGVTELYAAAIAVDWGFPAPGNWDTAANWNPGFAPERFTDVTINPDTDVTITGPASAATVFSMQLGDGLGTATVQLQPTGPLSVVTETYIGPLGAIDVGQSTLTTDLLTIEGGTLAVTLAGTAPGNDFGQVHVAGEVSIGSMLEIDLAAPFFPTPGESFQIMTLGSRSGEFDSVLGAGLIAHDTFLLPTYSDTDLTLLAVIPGDGNGDNTVDDMDYTLWANGFGTPGADFTDGDYNGDGEVGPEDYTLWANNFGQSVFAPFAASAVPEPSSLVLLLIALATLIVDRRRQR